MSPSVTKSSITHGGLYGSNDRAVYSDFTSIWYTFVSGF